jgi:plastocyanin
MRLLNDLLLEAVTTASSSTSAAQNLDHIPIFDLTASVTAANPSNKNFTSGDVTAATDIVTIAAHGLLTGTKVTLTTDDTLPGGLAAATDYYIIAASANTIKFATSQANAVAGTAIDLTNAGTGNHVVTITTTIAGSIKLQKNNEPENLTPVWFDIASSSQNFTGTSTLNWEYADKGFREIRAVAAVTSGTVTISLRINGKGG